MLLRGRQQITICAIGTAIFCVFLVLWYLPLRKKMRLVKQAKFERSQVIAGGTADAGQLPLLREQLKGLRSRLVDYEAGIPVQRSHGVFLHRIADLMKGHNLNDQIITPGEEIEADKFNCIPVSMRCTGELTQLTEFYRRLQNLDRLVRIEQVRLTNDASYGGQVTMETEAVVYYRTETGQGRA